MSYKDQEANNQLLEHWKENNSKDGKDRLCGRDKVEPKREPWIVEGGSQQDVLLTLLDAIFA